MQNCSVPLFTAASVPLRCLSVDGPFSLGAFGSKITVIKMSLHAIGVLENELYPKLVRFCEEKNGLKFCYGI